MEESEAPDLDQLLYATGWYIEIELAKVADGKPVLNLAFSINAVKRLFCGSSVHYDTN